MTDEFEVEKILGTKRSRGKTLYKVRWRTFGPKDDTWEPISHLKGCKELLEEFRTKELSQTMISRPKPKVVNSVRGSSEFSSVGSLVSFIVNTDDVDGSVTVNNRGGNWDDGILQRSALRERFRTDPTPTEKTEPQFEETTEEPMHQEDADVEVDHSPMSPFLVFLCIVFIILVLLFIYFT